MTTRSALISALALMGMALAASLVLYSQLPERVPTHWNLNGEVDGWSGKGFAALLLPAFVLLPLVLIAAGEWLSPLNFKVEPFRGPFNSILVILAALLAYLYGIGIQSACRTVSRFLFLLRGGGHSSGPAITGRL